MGEMNCKIFVVLKVAALGAADFAFYYGGTWRISIFVLRKMRSKIGCLV